MPESVTDRPTKAHEYVFLLTRSSRYYFDQEAVREKAIEGTDLGLLRGRAKDETGKVAWAAPSIAKRQEAGVDSRNGNPSGGRNVRSVWEIATQPYPEAHFATFPEALVERCVKAGSSEHGCCPVCGKPWEREVGREVTKAGEAYESRMERSGADFTPLHQPNRSMAQVPTRYNLSQSRATTLGWRPGCDHDTSPIPATVLDPFAGSGTTNFVARRLGRRSIGIELNAAYCELAARRMQQQSLEFA